MKMIKIQNKRPHDIIMPTGERLRPGSNEIPMDSYEKSLELKSVRNLLDLNWLCADLPKAPKPQAEEKKEEAKSPLDEYKGLSYKKAKEYLENLEDMDLLKDLLELEGRRTLVKLIKAKLEV